MSRAGPAGRVGVLVATMAFLPAGAGTAAAAPVPAPPFDAVCAGIGVPGLVVFVLTDSNGLYHPAQDLLGVVNAPFGCHDATT